jgi:hypothetical protein
MAHCIPTYMLASGLMTAGMNWSQALVTILLGNTIVHATRHVRLEPDCRRSRASVSVCLEGSGNLRDGVEPLVVQLRHAMREHALDPHQVERAIPARDDHRGHRVADQVGDRARFGHEPIHAEQ